MPEAPSLETARAARDTSPSFYRGVNPLVPGGRGFHPVCVCCGADVPGEEGRRVHAAPVSGFSGVAAARRPPVAFAAGDGTLPEAIVWTALDCPGQFAWLVEGVRTGLLGRRTARVLGPVPAARDYLIRGWCLENEGRKYFAGTALPDTEGRVHAFSRQGWIGRRDWTSRHRERRPQAGQRAVRAVASESCPRSERNRVRPALLAVLLLALSAAGPTPAATPPPKPEAAAQIGPDEAELEEVIMLLEDEQRRQRFLSQLRALREARAETAPGVEPSLGSLLVRAVAEPLQQASGQLSVVVTRLSALPGQLPQLRSFLASPERRAALLSAGGRLGIIVGASLLVAWLTRALLSPRKQEGPPAGPRLARGIVSAFRELLPVVVFALVAYALVAVLELRDATRLLAIAFANAGVAVGAALALARTVLDPRRQGHRLLASLADHDAAYLYVWLRRLVGLPVFGYFFLESALLLGLPEDVHGSLRTVLGLYVTALLVVLILQSRRPVAAWLTGTAEEGAEALRRSSPLRRLGGLWHLFAIFYVVAIFAVGAFEEGADLGFLVRASVVMLAVVVGFRYVNDWAQRLLGLLVRIPAELHTRHPELEARIRRYETILRRVSTALLGAVAAFLLLAGWGVDVGAIFASEAGRGLLGRVVRLAVIVGAVVLLWEAFTVVVEGMLREREQDGAVGGRSARLRTLLPLFRNTVRGVLVLLLSLTVLSEFGIDIGPLLAGAGVVGLAVGFGAQSLVKDVINGVFILLEDTITVGDVVSLGGHSGVVERMGIRTVRLRDLSGAVHTLPYGEVTTILNMTEDFSFALLDVGVAYRENTDEVVELLRAVAAELAEDPDFRDAVEGNLEVFGVNEFADSAVMVRVRQRTVAGQQWRVKRELNRRIKLRFDERGIEIPFPHRTLYFGVDKEGTAPPARLELDRLPGETNGS